jgi:prepilin-type N-terminal cleavage/methylation domain-containing protein
MMNAFKKKFVGFTLIEMSVVLVIISMLVGVMVTVFPFQENKDAYAQTNTTIKVIEQALLSYFNQKGYLPCPANNNDAISSPTFGASSNCGSPGTNPPAYVEVGSTPDIIRIGAVPTRELNLPDSYMFDGWNNRITYAVPTQLATNNATYIAHIPAAQGMVILDANGNTMHGTIPNTYIAYVLVSHGRNGNGAWNYAGTSVPVTCILGRNDGENCNNDANWRDQYQDLNSFDNIIRWSTKELLAALGLNPTIPVSSSPNPPKYAQFTYQASGATNLPASIAGYNLRNFNTTLYNNTKGVTLQTGASTVTFAGGKNYFIKEGHMACGTGGTQFARFTPGFTPIVLSTQDFLDPTPATDQPCVWQQASGWYSPATTTVTQTYTYVEVVNLTNGLGAGINTGGGDPYVFSRLEVWESYP